VAKIAEEALKVFPRRSSSNASSRSGATTWRSPGSNKADFDKAKIEAQRAVQAWTENMAARKLLNDINEIIVGGPTGLRGIRDVELQVCGISVEQAKLEIENHLLRGRRYQDAGMQCRRDPGVRRCGVQDPEHAVRSEVDERPASGAPGVARPVEVVPEGLIRSPSAAPQKGQKRIDSRPTSCATIFAGFSTSASLCSSIGGIALKWSVAFESAVRIENPRRPMLECRRTNSSQQDAGMVLVYPPAYGERETPMKPVFA